jgi:hypothetical protein
MQLFTTTSPGRIFVDGLGDGGGEVVASYPTYGEAQQAIDRLADGSFPLQYSEIVGRDLRLVERVTGRMTDGRAAAAGAATGAWFGLFIGLLVGLFTVGPRQAAALPARLTDHHATSHTSRRHRR